jgi:hypothetical protein
MMLVKLPRTPAQAKSLPGYEAEKYLGNEKGVRLSPQPLGFTGGP